MTQPDVHIDCDVLVVGGGINGAGIARDAAGRGLTVVLCDKDDLAAHTSSASTKLIHGGLRYLEHYAFGMVRKALIEREVLLRTAPHLIRPLRFVMPHDEGQRPGWLIRAGLFLYDHLARRELLPKSCGIDLHHHAAGRPLQSRFTRGFEYSDGWVDDARLVMLNAIDAAERGATILTYTRCESVHPDGGRWLASLRDTLGGKTITVNARSAVNATGPWATHFLQAATYCPSMESLRLVKGSHIVVKRLFDHPYAYLFQHPDGRIVFAIPYQHDFTLIGTTDLDYQDDLDHVAISTDEIAYLCELTNRYFQKTTSPADVLWSYAGIRPLLEDAMPDASSATRNYLLELDNSSAPMLSVFGGKLTTYRKLAEEAVDLIAPALDNRHPAWTAKACLPGGDLFGPRPTNRAVLEFDHYVRDLQQKYFWLAPQLVTRYACAYGTRTDVLLENRTNLAQMGQEIAPGLFEAEVDYWFRHEWARSAADMLWRRSKLGLHLPSGSEEKLASWIAARKML